MAVCSRSENFCNKAQLGVIVAIAKLWHSLRFVPGHITWKQRWETYSEEVKEKIKNEYGFSGPCHDTDESACKCMARAGSFCSLMRVLTLVALGREEIICFYDDSQEKIIPHEMIAGCMCKDAIDFQRMYRTQLDKLQRQLKSLPRNVFNEVYIWYLSKMTTENIEPLVWEREGRPQFFGALYCSNDILHCHHDYGKLVYDENRQKGCDCHGI